MPPGSAIGLCRLAACGAALAGLSLGAQQPAFRAAAQTVAVYATVQDSDGRLAPDLSQHDFLLFEDGHPKPITVFSTDPQPLRVAVMLDQSMDNMAFGSAAGVATAGAPLRASVMAFTDALDQADRVSVGSFGLEIAVGANLTRDRNEVARVLDEEIWSGGGTPLWQALSVAMTSLSAEPGRHVVLTFTNGRDTGSLPGWRGNQKSVEQQAAADNAMVYAVNPARRDHGPSLSGEIEALTSATGGGHFVVPRDADLAATFTRIADELRHQYLLGFVPSTLDGTEHTIEVRTSKAGMKVRARKSYVAHR
jgi:Ca-activated chloride channel family protein